MRVEKIKKITFIYIKRSVYILLWLLHYVSNVFMEEKKNGREIHPEFMPHLIAIYLSHVFCDDLWVSR